jgi:hypothetical protein
MVNACYRAARPDGPRIDTVVPQGVTASLRQATHRLNDVLS